jgi:hypothetical protein
MAIALFNRLAGFDRHHGRHIQLRLFASFNNADQAFVMHGAITLRSTLQ